MDRRKILAMAGGSIAVGTAGCTGLLEDLGSPSADCPTVVDRGKSKDPERNVVVDVMVENEAGEPLEGIEVELEDRGGSADDRFGTTCSDGTIRFIESVGPPPCNTITVKLPAYETSVDLGCHNGGTEREHTVTIDP